MNSRSPASKKAGSSTNPLPPGWRTKMIGLFLPYASETSRTPRQGRSLRLSHVDQMRVWLIRQLTGLRVAVTIVQTLASHVSFGRLNERVFNSLTGYERQ